MSFITIDAVFMESLLLQKGFVRGIQRHEITYTLCGKINPNVKITVYTTLTDGQRQTRSYASDSIKVAVYYDNGVKSFGIAKLPRINRTGTTEGVLARLCEKITEARRRASEWVGKNGSN